MRETRLHLMLETRIAHYQTFWESCRPTPAQYKDAFPFLREVDSFALCNAQLALEKAYKRFFKDRNTGFPKYKSKHHGKKSYTTNRIGNNIRLDDNARRLKLPKLGWLAIRQHKRIPDSWNLKSVTIEHCPSGRYTATILFERDTQTPKKTEPANIVGLDYASHGLYVSSSGERADYPGFYRNAEDKLVKEQRKLSLMVKGSANWCKQRRRVARAYEKTANQRRDYQHKKANMLADTYDAVAVESLNLKGMARKPKPKPDPDNPGAYLRNGRKAKSGLAKKHVGQRLRHVLHDAGIQARPPRQTIGASGQVVSFQPALPRVRLSESADQGLGCQGMDVPAVRGHARPGCERRPEHPGRSQKNRRVARLVKPCEPQGMWG